MNSYDEMVRLLTENGPPRIRYDERYSIRMGYLYPIATTIKKVIFNDPVTVILWDDGTKTVVKCENETFDPEKGMAMAITKKALGNEGNYYNIIKKWLPKEETDKNAIDAFKNAIDKMNEVARSFRFKA